MTDTGRRAPGAAPSSVFVRMYRGLLPGHQYKGWLGDCFLIRLVSGPTRTHILVDCGILVGSPEGRDRVRAVVEDIRAETGGVLDLLVVTHEHADHISGFAQAADSFFGAPGTPPRLTIGAVWMGWTENPDDHQANDLRHGIRARTAAVGKVVAKVAAMGFGATTNDLDRFTPAAADAESSAFGAAAAGPKVSEVMDHLRRMPVAAFPEPGTVLPTPGPLALRTFVLGPPRDEALLFKDAPSTGAAKETYLAGNAFNERLLLQLAGGSPLNPSDPDDLSGYSPFARRYCSIRRRDVDPDLATASSASDDVTWLRHTYYPAPGAADPNRSRRRIDGDWLAAAGPLALKLDSDTNNTSLALAFELPDKAIMLFAADAQVGNWLSWHTRDYVADGVAQTAADLLARVRLYKVGHHGSHNATLRERGLALMTRPDLVAMFPTDEELGARQGRQGWKMPNPDVRAALLKQTCRRILRNDDPPMTRGDRMRQAGDADFAARVRENDLFIEYQAYGSVA